MQLKRPSQHKSEEGNQKFSRLHPCQIHTTPTRYKVTDAVLNTSGVHDTNGHNFGSQSCDFRWLTKENPATTIRQNGRRTAQGGSLVTDDATVAIIGMTKNHFSEIVGLSFVNHLKSIHSRKNVQIYQPQTRLPHQVDTH